MSAWKVRKITEAAEQSTASLFTYPDVKAECLRLLHLLAEESNPGKPTNPALFDRDGEPLVKHLHIHAPTWYRLKVERFNLRIIFALIYVQGERVIEYIYGETIFDDNDNYIGLLNIVERTPHTYRDVQRDWKAAHRK